MLKLNKIYRGDCLEVMKRIPDGSVDLTVTSPPYDNLRNYNNSLTWNSEVWQNVLLELFRVTKQGGVVVWVVGDASIKGSETGTSFKQALHAVTCGFKLHDTMVYLKPDYKPLTHNRYEQQFEYMFVFVKGKLSVFNGIKDKPNIGHGRKVTGTKRHADGTVRVVSGANTKRIAEFGLRGNVWLIPTTKGKKNHQHPAMFPEKLAHDHVISWSSKNDVVLDPFAGSGTTGVVCQNLKRKYILIEKDKTYYQVAHKRLRENRK